MTAAAKGESQHLLPLQLVSLLAFPPPLVAKAGAVAALTPKMRMIAASRMRMAVSPSGSPRDFQGYLGGGGLSKSPPGPRAAVTPAG